MHIILPHQMLYSTYLMTSNIVIRGRGLGEEEGPFPTEHIRIFCNKNDPNRESKHTALYNLTTHQTCHLKIRNISTQPRQMLNSTIIVIIG